MESKSVTWPVPPLFLSITLHLKISCPPSPAHSQTSLVPGEPPSRLPPPRPPVPHVSIQVESDYEEEEEEEEEDEEEEEEEEEEESGFYYKPQRQHRLYPPPHELAPPGIHRDFDRSLLRAHFGDSCAETIL